MTRSSIILSGILGLLGTIILTTVAIFLASSGRVPILIESPFFTWALFLFLLLISLAEIPVMIYSMRRIIDGGHPKTKYIVLLTNFGYVLFAGVYAVPFILLTGKSTLELAAGVLLGALGFVRFISAVILIPGRESYEPK